MLPKPTAPRSLILAALFVALLACLNLPSLFAQPAPAADWYVDAATGSNSNSCLSSATPCLTIGAALALAEPGDTIAIAAGVYAESLELQQPVSIQGAGSGQTILDGGDTQRVLAVTGDPVTIADVTVRNGRVSDANGGGVFNSGGLTLRRVLVSGNSAANGAGIYNAGTLTLSDSQVSDNHGDGIGGGLLTWYGSTTTLDRSLVGDNSGHQGGGIYNLGTLLATDSTIAGNNATGYSGGGLIIFGGSVSLERVTISDNQSVANGGGISNQLGELTLINSTISGNRALQYAGLSNEIADAETTLRNSTIAFNTASGPGAQVGGVGAINGSVSIQNSIVAENGDRNCLIAGEWASQGHNLSSDSSCAFASSGDLPNTPAGLAPLSSFSGSPTLIHALLPGSAAIDAGDGPSCPASDQRGLARPIDGDGDSTPACDIGAFEVRQQLVVSDLRVVERDNGMSATAVFSISLNPASDQVVMVNYATADGSAIAGVDYSAASGSLTFSPGQSEHLVSVTILGDLVDEPDKTFALNLSGAANADIVDGQGLATIVDNDGLSALSIADASISEGQSGAAVVEVTVSLSPPAADTVRVNFLTLDGTALAGADYVALAGSLSFAPGQTSAQIALSVRGDTIDEGENEAFRVRLVGPLNASLADADGVVTIVDDDSARISVQPGPAVAEGQDGSRTAIFSISLSTPAAFAISVDYATASGSGDSAATAGVDYEPASGSLSFAAGQTSQTVEVTIYGDRDPEPDEQFSLLLSNSSPVPIAANTSNASILNDDTNEERFVRYLPALFN